jgi:hypothetical protein
MDVGTVAFADLGGLVGVRPAAPITGPLDGRIDTSGWLTSPPVRIDCRRHSSLDDTPKSPEARWIATTAGHFLCRGLARAIRAGAWAAITHVIAPEPAFVYGPFIAGSGPVHRLRSGLYGHPERIMASPFDYREMAYECLKEADRTRDADRKRVLIGLAKLYTRTSLALAGVAASEPAPRVP